MQLHGPYADKTGRKRLVIVKDDGKKTTISYARWLMQQHLGRELLSDEHVDHINDDRTDDRIENLQILSPGDNARKSAPEAKMFDFVCPCCGKEASKPLRDVRHNQQQLGKSGPYCSKSCAGRGSYRKAEKK